MKISISRSGDELKVTLRGDINEAAESALDDLKRKIETQRVRFDLEQVELVNSLGARHWILFIQSLLAQGVQLSFQNCSITFVECCNIYPRFAPVGSISSLYVPMDCPQCGQASSILVDSNQANSDSPALKLSCAKCGVPLMPQVALEEYFQCMSES